MKDGVCLLNISITRSADGSTNRRSELDSPARGAVAIMHNDSRRITP